MKTTIKYFTVDPGQSTFQIEDQLNIILQNASEIIETKVNTAHVPGTSLFMITLIILYR